MDKKWDGITERRKAKPPLEGRRQSDVRCTDHVLLWGHHDKDTEEHRGLVCKKMELIRKDLTNEVIRLEKVDESLKEVDEKLDEKINILHKTIVGKYWFRIVVGFLCVGIGGSFIQNNWAFTEILTQLKSTGATTTLISVNQTILTEKVSRFEKEIEALHKRQDVLRDASIKHLTDEHKK